MSAIKPLEWRVRDDTHRAPALGGTYTAWEIKGMGYLQTADELCEPVEGGIEGAKALAQADHETRTRWAMVPGPGTPSEDPKP